MLGRALPFVLLLTACLTARPPPKPVDLVSRLDTLIGQAEAQGSNLGAYVVDAKTGEVLYAHREHARGNSASTMKLATTAAALATLGGDYRFHTLISLQGKLKKDTFEGDLVVTASGDPSFGSRQFPHTEPLPQYIANALQAKGIRHWKGNIRILNGDPLPQDRYGPGWAWDDVARDYSGPTGPFVFHDNVVQILVHRERGHMNAVPEICGPITIHTDPPLAHPNIDIQDKPSDTNEGLDCLRDMLTRDIHCQWPLPPTPCATRAVGAVSVDDPAALFETSVLAALTDAGILHVAGPPAPATAPTEPLLDVESPPLRDLVRVTNKQSLNLYAERLAMAVAKARLGSESYATLQKALAQDQAERGIDPHDYVQVDGSGLSRYNMVTAIGLVQLVRSVLGTRYEQAMLGSLPITGIDGTLHAHVLAPTVRAWAKTGTLTGHRGFAGFIERPTDNAHPTVVFALLIGNTTLQRGETNELFDRFAELVALAPVPHRK